MIGIYSIRCKGNGKIYIGQSQNIENRFKYHKRDLANNRHYNSYLQNAFNKYGVENFEYEVVEECGGDELNEREKYWISHFDSTNPNHGYNKMRGGACTYEGTAEYIPVNKVCKTCANTCRQTCKVIVVHCPIYRKTKTHN